MLSVQGRSATGSAVLKIDFDAALLAVDDLLRPEPTEAYHRAWLYRLAGERIRRS